MTLFDLNPFIRWVGIHPAPLMLHNARIAYDYRLFYILGGTGSFIIEGTGYSFAPDSLFLIPSGYKYEYTFQDPASVRILILNFDLTTAAAHLTDPIGVVTEKQYSPSQLVDSCRYPFLEKEKYFEALPSIKPLLLNISSLFIDQPYLYRELASSLLKEVLIRVLQFEQKQITPVSSQTVNRILADIRKNYAQEMSNTSLAGKYGYHPYYLNRLIKAQTGISLHQYILLQRTEAAKNLLLASSLSIQEIAEHTGFRTAAQFSTAFRERTGQTPSAYRTNHKELFMI